MLDANAIATPTFDARPHANLIPDEHNPAVTVQSAKSYEDLMRENMKLRIAIRQSEAALQRIIAELDLMVAKCNTLAKGGGK